MRILRWLPSLALLLPWLIGPLTPPNDARIRDLAGPSAFRLLDWETVHLGERVDRLWRGMLQPVAPSPADTEAVRGYFTAPASERGPLREAAEVAIERTVADAYRQAGVVRSEPLPLPSGALFPPLLIALTPPPNVLVVAPRAELRVAQSSVLQALSVPAQEQLEASADSTGVSSLVAPIGGLATYPSMVLEEASAERMLSSVAHEWLHQYLIFYPLGAGYWQSQETREINETTADMVGQEVGAALAHRLELGLSDSPVSRQADPARSDGFDFRAFMRETRVTTEAFLVAGDIASAERYMRQRRDELVPHGYQIRKINQAYFALYGSYGEGFAASPANPIPGLLRALRARSATLGDFIFQVRGITALADLRRAAG